MLSKACEYGIRAVIHIAHQSQKGNRVSLKEVAKAIGSPEAFTAKILQTLSNDHLIISIKGSGGGYELIKEQQAKITLRNIVSAIDGDHIFSKCVLGLHECSHIKPCPAHNQYTLIRNEFNEWLGSTTIKELGTEMDYGMTFLKI